ncbi:hypothetical protein [Nocardia sp. NPDC056564]|uniref:hypothetical protein n=1 Tax=Nocardia sp. NPDC056564 TaxID=3345865 RepID=UPI003673631D
MSRSRHSVAPERVDVHERWMTRAAVDALHGDGTANDLGAQILGAEVGEFEYPNAVRR